MSKGFYLLDIYNEFVHVLIISLALDEYTSKKLNLYIIVSGLLSTRVLGEPTYCPLADYFTESLYLFLPSALRTY